MNVNVIILHSLKLIPLFLINLALGIINSEFDKNKTKNMSMRCKRYLVITITTSSSFFPFQWLFQGGGVRGNERKDKKISTKD